MNKEMKYEEIKAVLSEISDQVGGHFALLNFIFEWNRDESENVPAYDYRTGSTSFGSDAMKTIFEIALHAENCAWGKSVKAKVVLEMSEKMMIESAMLYTYSFPSYLEKAYDKIEPCDYSTPNDIPKVALNITMNELLFALMKEGERLAMWKIMMLNKPRDDKKIFKCVRNIQKSFIELFCKKIQVKYSIEMEEVEPITTFLRAWIKCN